MSGATGTTLTCMPRLLIALGAALLAGCGPTNPYIESPRPQEFAARGQRPTPGLEAAPRSIREIRYARWYIGEMRVAMQDRHRLQHFSRSALSAGVFGAAAGGAIAGLMGANRDLVAGLAAGAATGAAASALYFDRGMSQAYRVGLQGLACIDDLARQQQAYYIVADRLARRVEGLRRVANARGGQTWRRNLRAALDGQRGLRRFVAGVALDEADATRRLISAADGIAMAVNAEVARLEPDIGRVAAIGGQISAQAQVTALANLQAGLEFRSDVTALRNALRAAADASPDEQVTAPANVLQQDRATDVAATVGADPPAPAPTANDDPSVPVPQAVAEILVDFDALRASLESADFTPASCAEVGAPIRASVGRTVVLTSGGDPVTVRLAGGSGSFDWSPMTPLPAGLTPEITGATMKLTARAGTRAGTYVIQIRDPATTGARASDYAMSIIVTGARAAPAPQ